MPVGLDTQKELPKGFSIKKLTLIKPSIREKHWRAPTYSREGWARSLEFSSCHMVRLSSTLGSNMAPPSQPVQLGWSQRRPNGESGLSPLPGGNEPPTWQYLQRPLGKWQHKILVRMQKNLNHMLLMEV